MLKRNHLQKATKILGCTCGLSYLQLKVIDPLIGSVVGVRLKGSGLEPHLIIR